MLWARTASCSDTWLTHSRQVISWCGGGPGGGSVPKRLLLQPRLSPGFRRSALDTHCIGTWPRGVRRGPPAFHEKALGLVTSSSRSPLSGPRTTWSELETGHPLDCEPLLRQLLFQKKSRGSPAHHLLMLALAAAKVNPHEGEAAPVLHGADGEASRLCTWRTSEDELRTGKRR